MNNLFSIKYLLLSIGLLVTTYSAYTNRIKVLEYEAKEMEKEEPVLYLLKENLGKDSIRLTFKGDARHINMKHVARNVMDFAPRGPVRVEIDELSIISDTMFTYSVRVWHVE